ncbi:N-acetyltransferase [Roseicyclus sp. F158]|uniref:N-acetyltransferase n=1 Tax=Tropicimonas omnivorans TaxID=3075590 RepID=A0ABU3DD42_9RHOB|nr:N-acetyltransferase [Roseicyclus sp. F158]MDT0681617.1 N-acetyltransferase [Roseicyclus sp. F158]
MDFINGHAGRRDGIIALFKDAFTASEGEAEGDLVASLVTGMLSSVAQDDIFVSSAIDDGTLVGTVIFTRMDYTEDERTVFILSPAAISTRRQGEGIGQALLSHGLNTLRKSGVDVVLTYGDPNFYSKVGFETITEEIARAPLPLSHPEGWLGQSLKTEALKPLQGAPTCVAPLNDPSLW